MTTDHDAIDAYLRPGIDAYWKWTDDGEGLVVGHPRKSESRTLALRAEVLEVLERVDPKQWPPISELLLILEATRSHWDPRFLKHALQQVLESDEKIFETIRPELYQASSLSSEERVTRLVLLLERIQQLDPTLRTSVRAKATLITSIYEDGPSALADPGKATAILDVLRLGITESLEAWKQISCEPGPLITKDRIQNIAFLSSLSQRLESWDPEAFRNRYPTGLDELPATAEVELKPVVDARSLIEHLADDEELGGLARTARRLLAQTSLPQPRRILSDQEAGGLADLANRGSFDRLLVSELAHDDLTLAIRVAMNEALYLRPEPPRRVPDGHRGILIDAGIRSWGVPRVLLTSLALAFAANTPDPERFQCLRSSGASLIPVDLASRQGLETHLSVLEPDLNPAPAIGPFLERMAAISEPVEAVLLMTEDALDDPEVREALRRIPEDRPRPFLATVDRDGRFRLARWQPPGTPVIRQATIALDDLFRRKTQLIRAPKDLDPNLPAICQVDRFPIRLPHPTCQQTAWMLDGWGVLTLVHDRRLTLWPEGESGRGPIQVTDRLPQGRVYWVGPPDESGHVRVAFGLIDQPGDTLNLLRIDREGNLDEQLDIASGKATHVFGHRGTLFALHRLEGAFYCMRSGERLGRFRLPDGSSILRDRFFHVGPPHNSTGWYAITYDGRRVQFDLITLIDPMTSQPPLISLFERPGTDGPLGVTADGHLYNTSNRVVHKLDLPINKRRPYGITVPWVSVGGRYLYLQIHDLRSMSGKSVLSQDQRESKFPALIKTGSDQSIRGHRTSYVIDTVQGTTCPGPIMTFNAPGIRIRFDTVCRTEAGELVLRTKSHHYFALGRMADIRAGHPLRFEGIVGGFTRLASFGPSERLRGTGYRLSPAELPGGSRVVLDSRGLLHLKSSAPNVPEFTIVLSEGVLSGWCADGRTFGRSEFVDDPVDGLGAELLGRFLEALDG